MEDCCVNAYERKDVGQASGDLPQTGGEIRSKEEIAGYIADMVLELRNMAKDHDLEFLAYLLEMSFQEAFDLSQKKK